MAVVARNGVTGFCKALRSTLRERRSVVCLSIICTGNAGRHARLLPYDDGSFEVDDRQLTVQ